VLLPALVLSLIVPAGWVLLPRQTDHPVLWCTVLYMVHGMTSGAVAIGVGRLLYNAVVPPDRNTAYMAIYYAWMGLTGGVAPLLAGRLLARLDGWAWCTGRWVADGYTVLFLSAAGLLAIAWALFLSVRPDHVHTTRAVFRRLVALFPWRLGPAPPQ
jgi:hypothetical protein